MTNARRKATTSLEEGIQKKYDWFLEKKRLIKLRLIKNK